MNNVAAYNKLLVAMQRLQRELDVRTAEVGFLIYNYECRGADLEGCSDLPLLRALLRDVYIAIGPSSTTTDAQK